MLSLSLCVSPRISLALRRSAASQPVTRGLLRAALAVGGRRQEAQGPRRGLEVLRTRPDHVPGLSRDEEDVVTVRVTASPSHDS